MCEEGERFFCVLVIFNYYFFRFDNRMDEFVLMELSFNFQFFFLVLDVNSFKQLLDVSGLVFLEVCDFG